MRFRVVFVGVFENFVFGIFDVWPTPQEKRNGPMVPVVQHHLAVFHEGYVYGRGDSPYCLRNNTLCQQGVPRVLAPCLHKLNHLGDLFEVTQPVLTDEKFV